LAAVTACSQPQAGPSGEGVAPSFTAIPGTPPAYNPSDTASASVVRQVEAWSFNNDTGRALTTDNFVIYTTERSTVITQRMPAFLEAALANYRTAVGSLPTPARPIDVYVMNDRAQWQALTYSVLGERGHAVVNGIRRGGFTTQGKSLLYDIGAFDTMSIAAHEAWHAYTQTTFAETLPMWAEEGLATYMEGHRWNGAAPRFSGWANIARFDRLRVAVKDNALMPLEAVLASSPNQMIGMRSAMGEQQFGAAGLAAGGVNDGPVLWYSEAWALVHFLNEGEGGKYRPAFRQMLQDAASGNLRATVLAHLKEPANAGRPRLLASAAPTEAFRAYFGSDLAAIGGEFDRFCRRIVRVGAREAVTLGNSPIVADEK